MRRIIAVEPGEWVILPCILETDDCYYRVDVYPDGRVEASDDERFDKADFGGPDYKCFAAIYNSQQRLHDVFAAAHTPDPRGEHAGGGGEASWPPSRRSPCCWRTDTKLQSKNYEYSCHSERSAAE